MFPIQVKRTTTLTERGCESKHTTHFSLYPLKSTAAHTVVKVAKEEKKKKENFAAAVGAGVKQCICSQSLHSFFMRKRRKKKKIQQTESSCVGAASQEQTNDWTCADGGHDKQKSRRRKGKSNTTCLSLRHQTIEKGRRRPEISVFRLFTSAGVAV